MSENPDLRSPTYGSAVPNQGDLRFVRRQVERDGVPTVRNILQRWEWSYEEGKWDWYDVPLMEEEEIDYTKVPT